MEIKAILKEYWGYDSFRPLQEDIIQTAISQNPALAILPTGGGKSICYQVPAMAQDGICIVVSPLIALMKDQVANLKKRHIKATAIYSGMTLREIDATLDNCIYGGYKFLYVSPERLSTELFLARLEKMQVNLLAIDEAHCISQWGHDFRPAYLKIAEIIPLLKGAPVMALTATATPKVREDILWHLQIPDAKVFEASFARPNLGYVVRSQEDKQGKMLQALRSTKGSGIVYVRSRKRAMEVADMLHRSGISGDYYHAGLDVATRSKKQDDWLSGRTRIIVSTNAFGMGIDKPNVRLVVHYDIPGNLEAYYQEAGRAGRDEKKAFALLLTNEYDIENVLSWQEEQLPTHDDVIRTYNAMCNYLKLAHGSGQDETFNLDIIELCQVFNLKVGKVINAFRILEQHEILTFTEAVYLPARLMLAVGKEDLYKFQIANKQFDRFIKVLLRNYPGLHDEYVNIRLQDLVKLSGYNAGEVKSFLNYLAKAEIVDYHPATDSPRVTFLQPRLPDKTLKLNKQYLQERQDIITQQLDQMIAYARNTTICRTNFIQHYFGEEAKEPCGICDICIEHGDETVDTGHVQEQIKTLIASGVTSIEQLVIAVKGVKDKEVLEIIRNMLDEGIVIEAPAGHLEWHTS